MLTWQQENLPMPTEHVVHLLYRYMAIRTLGINRLVLHVAKWLESG